MGIKMKINMKIKINMEKLLIQLIILFPLVCQGQLSLDRQVIGATGNYSFSGTISLSATVGEPIVTTETSGVFTLTQGFQQPDNPNPSSLDDLKHLIVNYVLYPNPTQGYLTLELATDNLLTVDLEVYDLLGRSVGISVDNWQIFGRDKKRISLEGLAGGTYMLALKGPEGGVLYSFKVEKL